VPGSELLPRDTPFFENKVGECCYVRNCRDCAAYNGIKLNPAKDELMKNICTNCLDGYCFPPKSKLPVIFRSQCTNVAEFADKSPLAPNYFRADQDNLIERNTEWVLPTEENIYCHCKFSGKVYQVGSWIRDERYLGFVGGEPACQGDNWEILAAKPTGIEISGSKYSSVSCYDRGYCYKCNFPCKDCLGENTDQCLTCLDNFEEAETGLAPGQVRKCVRPKPMP
jgi:hypothetical protein